MNQRSNTGGAGANCTPYQQAVFGKVLAAVRGVLMRERVSLRYFVDDENNARFFDGLEAALAAYIEPPEEPRPEPQRPAKVEPTEQPDEPPVYWWNKD